MEPTPTEPVRPEPNPASASHEPRIAAPVMDVVPPPTAETPSVRPAAPVQIATEPAAVVPAPHETGDDLLATELQPAADQPLVGQSSTQVPTRPRNPHTLPIVITIAVVLLLSLLAIFAFMQSH